MKTNVVRQAGLKRSLGLPFSLLLVGVGLLSVAFAASAVAAPAIGRDGKVNACYRVKGKTKGAMRVVPAGKKCKKGERKLAWGVAGPAGQNGDRGPAGTNGPAGPAGSASATATASEAALQAKIAGLTVKVEDLEGLLSGLTNGELTGTVAKLSGITGLQLNETVGALPVVDSLCDQASTLTSQANLLRTVLGGLGLSPALEVIGLLQIPALPAALTAYTCPTS